MAAKLIRATFFAVVISLFFTSATAQNDLGVRNLAGAKELGENAKITTAALLQHERGVTQEIRRGVARLVSACSPINKAQGATPPEKSNEYIQRKLDSAAIQDQALLKKVDELTSAANKNKDSKVKFLQIWVFPNAKNVTPRYDQITLNAADRHNTFQQILSPNADDAGVWIHQNAWFHLAKFDKGTSKEYNIKSKGNGLYIFNLIGDIKVGEQVLNARDGYGIWDFEKLTISADSEAEFLLMEVPMQL